MIIAIEGVDGSGKTSLIAKLRKSIYSRILVASSGPPESAAQVAREHQWISSFPKNDVLICDRTRLISEPIYSKILRGGDSVLPRIDRSLIDELFSLVVYCRPSIETIIHNLSSSLSQQLRGVPEHLGELIREYDRVFDELLLARCPVIHFDYEQADQWPFLIRTINDIRSRLYDRST